MADVKISALTSYINPDRVNDSLPIVDSANSVTKRISINNMLGLTSAPVSIGDTQTLTAKTLTAPTINGATLSGTLSGTYTIGGTPTFPVSVVTLAGSQTLTNKILTSPTINAPTITNASITADAITGFSSANTGSIYGIAVTSSKISGTSLTNSTVGASQLNTGAQRAYVATLETTASTSYVDLATVGPSVTVTIGVNGLALIMFSAEMENTVANDYAEMTIVVSGTNTIAAGTNPYRLYSQSVAASNTPDDKFTYAGLVTGLATGSTTFKCQYKSIVGGTSSFQYREISVIPL